MQKLSFLMLVLAVCILQSPAHAQTPAGQVTIEGDIPKTVVLTAEQFKAMNRITIHSTDMAGKTHDYSGIAVTDILKSAGIIQPAFNRDNLNKYVIVRSSDNYEVLFSMSELDSAFSGRTIILADMADGQPLPLAKGPYKIVIPGEEKRQARSIWSVTHFVIRNSKDQ